MPPTAPSPSSRRSGRPRTFDDLDVFGAISNVLSTSGFTSLTFALVAEEIGCTTSALIRRYGSKNDLVARYLSWTVATITDNYDLLRRVYASPIDVIRVLMMLPASEPPRESYVCPTTHPAQFSAVFVAARSEPNFRPIIGSIARKLEEQFRTLLDEAGQNGELIEHDSSNLAHLLVIAFTGAVTWWFDFEEGTLEAEIERTFDLVVSAYLVAH